MGIFPTGLMKERVLKEIFSRDGFKCQYCGLDGAQSFDNWRQLCCDHLILDKEDPRRETPEFIVTACRLCNELFNRKQFKGNTREDLVQSKKTVVIKELKKYHDFWRERVSKK